MRIIIHDLGSEYNKILQEKSDAIICADGKYAPCQGCFGCWTKSPAQCFMKDKLREISRIVGTADEVIVISENCYGSYSPAIKNILDRSIGLSTPFSTYRGKQMHHTLRYGKRRRLSVIAHGDMTEPEAATFALLVERNAINFGFTESGFQRLTNTDGMEALL